MTSGSGIRGLSVSRAESKLLVLKDQLWGFFCGFFLVCFLTFHPLLTDTFVKHNKNKSVEK